MCAAADKAIRQHYHKCLRDMLQLRQEQLQHICRKSTNSSLSSFLTHQNVEMREEVLFVSSMTLEGMELLYKSLEEVCTGTLLPALEAEVPETWLAFEDRLQYSAQDALQTRTKQYYLHFCLLRKNSYLLLTTPVQSQCGL